MPDFIGHSSCASLLHALFSALRASFKAVFRLALTPVPPRLAAGRAHRPYVDGFKGEGRKALRALTGAVLRFTFRHPACRRRGGRVGGLRRFQGREREAFNCGHFVAGEKTLRSVYLPFILLVCVWCVMDTPGRVETGSRAFHSPRDVSGDRFHKDSRPCWGTAGVTVRAARPQ